MDRRERLAREMTHQPPRPPMSDAARATWAAMMTPYKLAYDIGEGVATLPWQAQALQKRVAGDVRGEHYDESGQRVEPQFSGGSLLDALTLGLDMGAGGLAASSAAGTGANAAGMFVGPRALGPGGERARAAQRLTAESGQPGAGWEGYKAWVAPTDDIARAEIMDPLHGMSGSRVHDLQRLQSEEGLTLMDILNHPKLFDEYPDLKDMPVGPLRGMQETYGGVYNTPLRRGTVTLDDGREVPEAIQINVDHMGRKGAEPAYRSLLHEVQHAVQARENMAMGGNAQLAQKFIYPEGAWEPYQAARSNFIKTLGTSRLPQAIRAAGGDVSQLIDLIDDPRGLYRAVKTYVGDDRLAEEMAREAERLMGMVPEPTMSPFEAYLRLAGETEARATADRAGWPLDKRFKEPPMIRPGRTGYFDYGYGQQFTLLPPEGADPFKDVYGIVDYLDRNGGQ